jgi:hypothetical protein
MSFIERNDPKLRKSNEDKFDDFDFEEKLTTSTSKIEITDLPIFNNTIQNKEEKEIFNFETTPFVYKEKSSLNLEKTKSKNLLNEKKDNFIFEKPKSQNLLNEEKDNYNFQKPKSQNIRNEEKDNFPLRLENALPKLNFTEENEDITSINELNPAAYDEDESLDIEVVENFIKKNITDSNDLKNETRQINKLKIELSKHQKELKELKQTRDIIISNLNSNMKNINSTNQKNLISLLKTQRMNHTKNNITKISKLPEKPHKFDEKKEENLKIFTQNYGVAIYYNENMNAYDTCPYDLLTNKCEKFLKKQLIPKTEQSHGNYFNLNFDTCLSNVNSKF